LNLNKNADISANIFLKKGEDISSQLSLEFAFTYRKANTLDLSVAKNGSKQVNSTNFGFLMVKLTSVPLPWQHE